MPCSWIWCSLLTRSSDANSSFSQVLSSHSQSNRRQLILMISSRVPHCQIFNVNNEWFTVARNSTWSSAGRSHPADDHVHTHKYVWPPKIWRMFLEALLETSSIRSIHGTGFGRSRTILVIGWMACSHSYTLVQDRRDQTSLAIGPSVVLLSHRYTLVAPVYV